MNSVAAVVRGTPTVSMMGSTIEPTMMIAPSPKSDEKSRATTAASASASHTGASPPNSAA